MKRLIRFWMRRRFTKAMDKADWRTSTLKPEASREVEKLRPITHTGPVEDSQGVVVANLEKA